MGHESSKGIGMPLDAALAGALHIEYLRQQDVAISDHPHHALFQTSTIDALLDGRYDGDVTFAELGKRGDLGLGTVDALDGEMILLDSRFYQVRSDGRAYEIEGRTKTPFAVVTFFEPNLIQPLPNPMDFAGLCSHLDALAPDAATLYAVRVDAFFEHVRTRSVPRQRKPYPPLSEVVRNQPTFDLHDVRGSLVGFRFPIKTQGLNVAGYHFHFITEDRNAGGHVLGCCLSSGEIRIDHEVDLGLELPAGVELPMPGTPGREGEIDRIEREG